MVTLKATNSSFFVSPETQLKEKEEQAEKLTEHLEKAKTDLQKTSKDKEELTEKLQAAKSEIEEERRKHLTLGASSSKLDSKVESLEKQVRALTEALDSTELRL